METLHPQLQQLAERSGESQIQQIAKEIGPEITQLVTAFKEKFKRENNIPLDAYAANAAMMTKILMLDGDIIGRYAE